MNETQLVQLAYSKHQGQMYGDNPYTYHLESVAHKVYELFKGDADIQNLVVLAYLHDILEDTDVTIQELYDATLPYELGDVLLYLTKRDNEVYDQYMFRLVKCPLAVKIKFCDSLANLEESIKSGWKKGIRKYTTNLKYLADYL